MISDDEYTFDEALRVLTGQKLDMDRGWAFRVLAYSMLMGKRVTGGAKVTPVTVTFSDVPDGKYFHIELPGDDQ